MSTSLVGFIWKKQNSQKRGGHHRDTSSKPVATKVSCVTFYCLTEPCCLLIVVCSKSLGCRR